ncbi:MAG: FtsW/RodA/SpoVE family cell cycle protein [Myxococcota bacterium]
MNTSRVRGSIDKPLVVVLLLVVLLGLYNLSSAGRSVNEGLYLYQGFYAVIGAILIAVTISIDYRNFEGLAVPIYLAVIGLLFFTLVGGRVVKGSRRWLYVGPIGIQTSDLAKLAVVFLVAKTFHAEKKGGPKLTLREIFRPMNISRPLLLALTVLLVTLVPDRVVPAALKQRIGVHTRTLGKLSHGQSKLRVGRDPAAEVQVPGAGLEPFHAELLRGADGQFLLRDLGSPSGVFQNGVRIEGEVVVQHDDVLRFGLNPRSELIFQAPLTKLRPFRSWVAALGALWLILAIGLQFKKGSISSRDLFAPIDGVVLPVVLILVQPDLGTALVVLLVAFTIILYVGLEPLSLVALVAGTTAASAFAWHYILKPYQKQRVLTFLDPTADLSGAGYHQNQSLIAIGSGGMFGKGHGQGTQTQLSFLPEQQTDFIFSVWSEEHGFLGSALVVVLFMALILLSFRVATQAKDRFGALLAVGMTSIVFWHAIINMLMVLHLAPVVGVPLPFWSNGGSNLITTLVAMGVVFSVGMRRYVF